MQWYCNCIYHRAKAIVYQNEHEKSCFSKTLEEKGCIIPNPVSVTAKKAAPANVIATAGRLMEQKNQKILVAAMAQVHKTYPDVKCRIYGEGTLRPVLQSQIEALGLQDVVTLEGLATDIHERLAQCGIFALTSDYEGLSNALIEAMMVGLPCITTDYPGARELIVDGETGLVTPLNDVDALAEALIKLIENKDGYADKLALEGQAFTARFQAETVLAQWRSVIGE